MKIVFLCGSNQRHIYIANQLYKTGFLKGLIIEQREEFMPQPPGNLGNLDRENFIKHFQSREAAETKFFGNVDASKIKEEVKYKEISLVQLNSEETIQFIRGIEPDVILSYGVHKLDDKIIDICPERAFNIHGGLSPWYKGCITMFWPFYFLRPNWTGVTVHHLSARMDAGDIVHQVVPTLERGDKLHEVACKAVLQTGKELPVLMQMLAEHKELPRVSQRSNGKLFVASDWTPQHLRLIYNTFNDDIVDKYLDGEITSMPPKLVRAF
jgi:methionyl-tRNA formyltransferase